MSKAKKKKSARLSLKQKSNSKKIIQIITVIVIAVFGLIYIFKPKPVKTINTKRGTMDYSSAYQFEKDGELVFQNVDGGFLTKIDIEIAETDVKRERGLMYRNKMEEDQGMLFIFDDEMPRSFWMKNTLLPLDMIFVNSKYEIINIRKRARPFDLGQYTSTAPAKYVIEVNAGYTDKFDITPGDKISFRIQ